MLDRTFYLYRNNFVLFAGIAIITPALKLIALLVQLKIFGPVVMPQQPEALTPQFLQAIAVRVIISVVVGTVIYLVGTALASSATAYAVSMVHLGKTTTIAESYSRVKPIFLRILWLLCGGSNVYLWTAAALLSAYLCPCLRHAPADEGSRLADRIYASTLPALYSSWRELWAPWSGCFTLFAVTRWRYLRARWRSYPLEFHWSAAGSLPTGPSGASWASLSLLG